MAIKMLCLHQVLLQASKIVDDIPEMEGSLPVALSGRAALKLYAGHELVKVKKGVAISQIPIRRSEC